MIDIYSVRLLNLLPVNLKQDLQVTAIAETLTSELQNISLETVKLMLLDTLDDQPEEVIDMLAFDLHVDFYDANIPLEQKCELVRTSEKWHKTKGTPWAVEQVVSIIFSNAKVSEWFEYGGTPGYFRVETDQTLSVDTDLDRLVRIINATKRKSIWLENVTIKRNLSLGFFTTGFISDSKVIELRPIAFQMPDLTGNLYLGGAIGLTSVTTIMPEVI